LPSRPGEVLLFGKRQEGLDLPGGQVQVSDLIGVLFSQRVDRSPRADDTDDTFTTVTRTDPQPIMNPFIAMLPPSMQAMGGKPLLFIAFVVVVLLLWLLF